MVLLHPLHDFRKVIPDRSQRLNTHGHCCLRSTRAVEPPGSGLLVPSTDALSIAEAVLDEWLAATGHRHVRELDSAWGRARPSAANLAPIGRRRNRAGCNAGSLRQGDHPDRSPLTITQQHENQLDP